MDLKRTAWPPQLDWSQGLVAVEDCDYARE
jgi:hypothetical protein